MVEPTSLLLGLEGLGFVPWSNTLIAPGWSR